MVNTNPCCMPLKVGVKIVTHLSMALAIAVGCMGVRLISISSEVTRPEVFQNPHPPHLEEWTYFPQHPGPTNIHYAKVLLISGLMAISAVFFQFLTSFLLLCFINREEKASSQIWVAVNCSVLFCLSTTLVLFLCEGHSLPHFSLDENLFLSLLTLDTLLSIYFLWVVMAFI